MCARRLLNCPFVLHSVTLERSELCKNCSCDSQMRSVFQKDVLQKQLRVKGTFFSFEIVAFNDFTNSSVFVGLACLLETKDLR